MKRFVISAVSLVVMLVLVAEQLSVSSLADGGKDFEDKPIRLVATAMAGPIGQVESFGAVTVNGRMVGGDRFIWDGETVQADRDTLRLRLDALGRVWLAKGAIARFAASVTESGGGKDRPVMVASLASGDILVTLNEQAEAYVEAGGSVFSAAAGAKFRVGLREGQPALYVMKGIVQVQDQPPQRRLTLRPVGLGSSTRVRARATRQIQVRVTDENDRPVPDQAVTISLGTKEMGSLNSQSLSGSTVTATTNAQGIATASFSAGAITGSTPITATVAGTTATWTGTITVSTGTILSGTVIGAIVAAAGAGVAAGVVKSTSGDEGDEGEETLSPPRITPRR